MGIVPWVSKSADISEVQAVVDVAPVDVVESVAADKALVTPMPYSLEELKVWLPSQPVRSMLGRTGPQFFSGTEDAPLLVVVEGVDNDADTEPMRSPFNAESGCCWRNAGTVRKQYLLSIIIFGSINRRYRCGEFLILICSYNATN